MSDFIEIVYSLSDPFTKEIRYIGKTSKSLKSRLIEHKVEKRKNCPKCKWIQALRKKKTFPLIEAIEICDLGEGQSIEKFWIEQCRQWGFNLLNIDCHLSNKIRNFNFN